MTDFERESYLVKLQEHLGIPCVDPVSMSLTLIANFLLTYAA